MPNIVGSEQREPTSLRGIADKARVACLARKRVQPRNRMQENCTSGSVRGRRVTGVPTAEGQGAAMARIGKIYLGGRKARGADQSELVNGAVAFQLDRPASEDWQYRSEDATWVAEINARQESIVARTSGVLQRNDVVRIGFEQAQRALDVVTFETNSPYSISVPGDSHVVLFRRDGDLVVQHVGVLNLAFSVRADVEVRDKDGRLVTQPPPPSSVWSAPLRYYRLSQTANELYEAYRNLFLALESLLNGICPKARREGEKQWLLRAFQVVSAKVNLGQFVPGGTADSAAYLVAAQYEQIRCRLFHGKGELPGGIKGTVLFN